MEKEITRRELLLRGIVVASGLVLSSLLAACAEIPETGGVAGWTPTPTPEVMPTHTPTATPEPSPTATRKPTATATSEPATPTPEEATPTPEPTTPTPAEATPTPEEPKVYVTVQQITGYTSPGGAEIGHIIPGQKFTILKEEDGWLYIRLEAGGEGWIQASETAYYPEGEVPPPTPTPEKPPAVVCTEPHWPERTPDRKTGIVINFGNQRQEIFPEGQPVSPHYVWMKIDPDFNFLIWRRDGRITEIDRNNQIITFDLGGGLIVKRKFASETQVVMRTHNVYRGMPMDDVWQTGGNLCDLQEGDAASILTLSEGEVANPSVEGVAWGIYIVQ